MKYIVVRTRNHIYAYVFVVSYINENTVQGIISNSKEDRRVSYTCIYIHACFPKSNHSSSELMNDYMKQVNITSKNIDNFLEDFVSFQLTDKQV